MITFSYGTDVTDVTCETIQEAQVLRKYLGFGPWVGIPTKSAQLAFPCIARIEKMPVCSQPRTDQVHQFRGHHA